MKSSGICLEEEENLSPLNKLWGSMLQDQNTKNSDKTRTRLDRAEWED